MVINSVNVNNHYELDITSNNNVNVNVNTHEPRGIEHEPWHEPTRPRR